MTTSSVSVSAETLKQLNAKIDALRTLLNSLTPVVAETKSEPELVIVYYDVAKTKKYQEYYMLKNKRHGKYTTYFQNGNVMSVWNYNNDTPHGIRIEYNEDGSFNTGRKYENGVEKARFDA